jgi:aspartyl protease family protein
MNRNEARRLGIDYIVEGEPAYVQTASGVSEAYRVQLETIAVGKIKLNNIDAIVVEGDSPEEILLGMSFLGRLSVKHENEVMSLQATF